MFHNFFNGICNDINRYIVQESCFENNYSAQLGPTSFHDLTHGLRLSRIYVCKIAGLGPSSYNRCSWEKRFFGPSGMEEGVVTVNRVPTRIVTIGGWIGRPVKRNKLILMIPGPI